MREKTKDSIDQESDEFKNAMFIATEKGYPRIVRGMLLFDKRDHPIAKFRDAKYRTLLHVAIENGRETIAWSLFKHPYVNVNYTTNETKDTVLHTAASHLDNMDLFERIVGKSEDVDARNKMGITPLMKAVRSGRVEKMRILLEAGADPNVTDKRKRSISDRVIKEIIPSDQANAFRILAEHGADFNYRDSSNRSVLHRAIQKKALKEAVKVLIEHGADVNAGWGERKNTPLHMAVHGGLVEIVKLILESGKARLDIKNSEGQIAQKMIPHNPKKTQKELKKLFKEHKEKQSA